MEESSISLTPRQLPPVHLPKSALIFLPPLLQKLPERHHSSEILILHVYQTHLLLSPLPEHFTERSHVVLIFQRILRRHVYLQSFKSLKTGLVLVALEVYGSPKRRHEGLKVGAFLDIDSGVAHVLRGVYGALRDHLEGFRVLTELLKPLVGQLNKLGVG